MILTAYQAMQHAVDIVNRSEHNRNKIASCLFHGDDYIVENNHRPQIFRDHFTPDIKIGRSSQFLHSEIACIYAADFDIEGASICITDPPCPNCAKAICEAGIAHVYIDNKGLDKDFAKRRGEDFESMSLLMFEKAGIAVSIIHRKEERIQTLFTPPVATRKNPAKGIEFFDWDEKLTLRDYLKMFRDRQAHTPWAIAKVTEDGVTRGILAFEELTPGLTPRDYIDKNHISEKYRLPIDPLNRLMVFAKRKHIKLADNVMACNLHPSSRALSNAVGFGIETILVGEMKPDHDDLGHIAAEHLRENNILNVETI